VLAIADLQNVAAEACTRLQREKKPGPLQGHDPALLAALKRLGPIVIGVPVGPEGIAELVDLGWLDRGSCRHSADLADAVIDLATAALAAGMRP
jgi:hypothetical protein